MNMFKGSAAETPEAYLDTLPDDRRADARSLDVLIRQSMPKGTEVSMVSGMIGYGSYHYRYSSGKQGDWPIVSLANRKDYISLYVMCVIDGQYLAEMYKERLPKASIGKSCIRFRSLEDVDRAILSEIVAKAFAIGGPTD